MVVLEVSGTQNGIGRGNNSSIATSLVFHHGPGKGHPHLGPIFNAQLKKKQTLQSRCQTFQVAVVVTRCIPACAQSIVSIMLHGKATIPFSNKPWFLPACSTSLLKTLWEKEKLLATSNFSFFHSVFYLLGEFSAFFIKFEIVVCKLFEFGTV